MLPSNSKSWRCENEAFVRSILQIPQVEDVKTKLSCDASLTCQKLKLWKRSFCVMLPSNSASWRCENEAFVRCVLQMPKVEAVKTMLSCDGPFKFQKLKMVKRSSKTGSRRQSGKTAVLEHFETGTYKESHQCQNRKICCQSSIRNSDAAITTQFTNFICKTQ